MLSSLSSTIITVFDIAAFPEIAARPVPGDPRPLRVIAGFRDLRLRRPREWVVGPRRYGNANRRARPSQADPTGETSMVRRLSAILNVYPPNKTTTGINITRNAPPPPCHPPLQHPLP